MVFFSHNIHNPEPLVPFLALQAESPFLGILPTVVLPAIGANAAVCS
jgi:hypothetical protein